MESAVQLAVMGIVAVLMGVVVAFTLITGSSPMPTRRRVRDRVLEAIPPDRSGTIYDLGSGWGTLVFPLARRFPGCRVIGVERSPLPWLFSRLRAAVSGAPNLEVRRGDFFRTSLADASVVVCYLAPNAMKRLGPKFETELPAGALVISNTFTLPEWTAEEVHTVPGMMPTPVYVYRMRS